MVLFVDASTINLRSLIRERGLPFRLLLIGLPLTMVLGLLLARLLFVDMNIWALSLMAFILSPTDAALGQAVVTSDVVPENIKQAINVESGLNDGIALPPILVCLAGLSVAATEQASVHYWIAFTLKQFLFGPLVGGLVGWLGGMLVDKASQAGWMNSTFQRLTSASLAVLAFALAEMLHGNGFIAAFFGGLMLGTHTPIVRERIQEFGEAEGQQLQLFIFLLLGLILVPRAAGYWDSRAWLYALLSLSVIRMLPVALSLAGTNLAWPSIAFIGWFGPRGIASILYLLMAVIEIGVAGHEQMISIAVLTVLLSIFLHGITAVPLSRLYAGPVADSRA
jgi:sodium/hydrogen antiporter